MTDQPLHHERFVARVELEAVTPFLIGGGSDALSDITWVADANGLPALPGSSVAGVLRAEWARRGRLDAEAVFGSAATADGHGSRLSVSWGCIQDSGGHPVTGLVPAETLSEDPVLGFALEGVIRDHVRIGQNGVVDGRGKFDERLVAAGHRFTLELELTGSDADAERWEFILSILGDGLSLGGKSRRGFGRFTVVSIRQARFDLSEPAGLRAYSAHPVDLRASCLGLAPRMVRTAPTGGQQIRLRLKPTGLWRFGGQAQADGELSPLLERRVLWDADGRGCVSERLPVIPGSAVRGALRHRCRFHANARRMRTDEAATMEQLARCEDALANAWVVSLFGNEPSTKDEDGEMRPGAISIDDVLLADVPAAAVLTHVSLDRFTQGTRPGFLFQERAFDAVPIEIVIRVAPGPEEVAISILRAALEDLAQGRLSLGGGVARGHGYMTGDILWADGTVDGAGQ